MAKKEKEKKSYSAQKETVKTETQKAAAAHEAQGTKPAEGDMGNGGEIQKTTQTGARAEDGANPDSEGREVLPVATIRINGGEPIDAFSEEGQLAVQKLFEDAKTSGEKPKVSLNGGPEYDYDSPELEKAFNDLDRAEGDGSEKEFSAHDEDTDANAAASDEAVKPPTDAEIKAAGDSTTVTNPITGLTSKQYSPENPNETFTEPNSVKAEVKSAAALAEKSDEPEDTGANLKAAIDKLLSFGAPIAGALSSKPAVMQSWQEAVQNLQIASAKHGL